MYKYFIRIPLTIIFVIGCSQVSVSPWERATAHHLFQLMNKRLSFMKEVAAFKFQTGLPIEDKQREDVVIQNAIEGAADYHLESKGIQAFIQAQIEAAKDIQGNYFRQWKDTHTYPHVPSKDLQTEIRPRLAAISRDIIDTLGLFLVEGGTFSKELETVFYGTVTVENLSPASQKLLFEALRNVHVQGES